MAIRWKWMLVAAVFAAGCGDGPTAPTAGSDHDSRSDGDASCRPPYLGALAGTVQRSMRFRSRRPQRPSDARSAGIDRDRNDLGQLYQSVQSRGRFPWNPDGGQLDRIHRTEAEGEWDGSRHPHGMECIRRIPPWRDDFI